MDNWALKTVPVNKFGEILIIKASQLLTSKKVNDVCGSMCQNMDSNGKEKGTKLNLFHVTGQTGSGRTTFCKAVVKNIIQNHSVKESEIVFVNIDKNDNPNCVWNYGVQLAKTKNLGSIAILLTSPNSTYKTKEKAMVDVLDSFKVVCFDNLSISETKQQLYTLLMSIVDKLRTNVICVSKASAQPPKHGTLVTVDGLNPAVIGSDLNWQKNMQYLKTKYGFIDENIGLNPTAVQLLVKAVMILGVLQYKAVRNQSPVLVILNSIWEHLADCEKEVLLQLSELHQPLPLKDEDALSTVIKIGLVEYETPGTRGNLSGQVFLSDCVREFVLTKREGNCLVNATSKFDVLQCWMALLSEELIGLINEAKNNSWPFVPEKWQYVKNVSQKESYNVKDLITMEVKNLPHLTYFGVLQEILHHSILRKDHENMAAILFLIDRYIYWQGGSQTLLDIVDSIMKEKPQLPIAPQLVIRKARVLRRSGDLQGAEKVLDKLLNENQKIGSWQYREKHHYLLVKAVCVQIKGEIQATIGHWRNSAKLLLDSVNLFKELPETDKKGLSSSLGLLLNSLRHMSVDEFEDIAQRYSLKESHPYLQGYYFGKEAAELAKYTPLYYARHKRGAGEMLLEYSQLTTVDLEAQHLKNALIELKESLVAHKSLDSLKSREQYYEFITALYKISCVLEHSKHEKHFDIKKISMMLFDHYCRNQATIVHDDNSATCIKMALSILHLPAYRDISQENTTGHFAPDVSRAPVGRKGKAAMVDRFADTLEAPNAGSQAKTVDRYQATVLTTETADKSEMISGELVEAALYNQLPNTDVHECEVSSYDAVNFTWPKQRTLVYIGEPLNLSEDNKGAQRNPYMVEYLSQDQPMGKYVGKRYKKPRRPEQYKEDVRCQMTARHYVGLFNQELYNKGIEVSPIQFLPVVMVSLLTHSGQPTSIIYNVEPYMQGSFKKLTNNLDWVELEGPGSKLVLAFSHFTYERSNRTLLITDHQGWTTEDHLSTTFLTDPQIHSVSKTSYGTGNLGMRGIKKFWEDMHEECNEICSQLGLTRP